MIENKFFVYNTNGFRIAQLTETYKAKWNYTYNDFGKLNLEHSGNDLDSELVNSLVPGNEIRIYRRNTLSILDTNEKLIYSAEIVSVKKSTDDNGVKRIVLDCKQSGWLLSMRYISKTFTTEQEEDIAWEVIDETQTNDFSGDYTADQVGLGITQGSLEATGYSRTITYVDANVLTILQDLPSLKETTGDPTIRGFRIGPDLIDDSYLEFNYEKNFGIERESIILLNETIQSIEQTGTIEGLATRIIGTGLGGISQTTTSTEQNILNSKKLRQKYSNYGEIQANSVLLERIENEREQVENIQYYYSIKLVANLQYIGDFRVGDIISISYDDGLISLNSQFKIYGIDLNYDENGLETCSLDIAQQKPTTVTDIAKWLASKTKDTERRLTYLEK